MQGSRNDSPRPRRPRGEQPSQAPSRPRAATPRTSMGHARDAVRSEPGRASSRGTEARPSREGRARRDERSARPSSRKGQSQNRPLDLTQRTEGRSFSRAKQQPNRAKRSGAARGNATGGLPGYSTAPRTWTKEAPKGKGGAASAASANPVVRVLKAVGGAVVGVLAFFAKIVLLGIQWFLGALQKSRAFALVAALVAVLVVVGSVDTALNWGRAYAGVHVGSVDVSGKTAEEAQALIEDAYAERLAQASVIVYANQEVADTMGALSNQEQQDALSEQLSFEEARDNKRLWKMSAADLGATLPAQQLAAEAVTVGRETGGPLARLSALFGGWNVAPRADYGESQLEALANEIDHAVGNPRVDYGIAVEAGKAHVTEGHDGIMVDRAWLAQQLSEGFLADDAAQASFVAEVDPAPLRIDAEEAQAACDAVNQAIANGAAFSYNGASWDVGADELGAWVTTRIEGEGDDWKLNPYIDEEHAKPEFLARALEHVTGEPVAVTFTVEDGTPYVHASEETTIPLTADAVHSLDEQLFAGYRGGGQAPAAAPSVEIQSGTAPQTLTFDAAIESGIVGPISTFTTEFTSNESMANRNHNIKLGAEKLNNSIAAANGGEWSFQDTCGESGYDQGFLDAGIILGDEFSEAAGGGICQVATTVFLAVYESGFPVLSRTSHSLYMASYPAGRDAAVSWPDLDLVWQNDSSSDVLMRTSCTDTSITVTLYGVHPGYQVSTETGEWQEGEKYEIVQKVDEAMASGASYVKTIGVDGSSISVVRTVKDVHGNLLREDAFHSTYNPVNEVIVTGPDTDLGDRLKRDGEKEQ